MTDLIGQRLGQYEILGVLGTGGMSTVYRARQTSMRRDVAIKVISAELVKERDFMERFKREARIIAGLSHPHILKVFDSDQHDALLYLVTELLPGGSLSDELARGPFKVDRAVRVLDQIASALDYAHGLGIIHRDMKPQNVLLDGQGNAHLTDFGLARLIDQRTVLTKSGVAMGTPTYMPPEQWQGLPLTAQADIYALGITLFEILTGRPPFAATNPAAAMMQHLKEAPPSILPLRPDLPPEVDSVFLRALAKDPEARFATAGDLASAFKEALAGVVQPGDDRPAEYLDEDTVINVPISTAPMSDTLPPAVTGARLTSAPATANPARRMGLYVAAAVVVLLVLVGGVVVFLAGR